MAANTPGPTWYDILGITPDATPADIKAAWRDATDKFEPGTGATQFRLFNEAADVLLDPDKRAAYDAELAPSPTAVDTPETPAAESVETPETPAAEPVETPEAVATEPVGTSEAVAAEPVETAEMSEASDLDPIEPPADEVPTEPRLDKVDERTGIRTSRLIVSILAVLALLAVVSTVVLGLNVHHKVTNLQADLDARSAASSTASRALTAVLSYDYRSMDTDRDRSAKFLTPSYRKEFLKTFALLTDGPNGTPGGAEKTKAVVTASVLSTAVQDASKNTVRVLVFVNQSSVKGTASPAIFQNRVVATMVRSGNSWLVDNIKSY